MKWVKYWWLSLMYHIDNLTNGSGSPCHPMHDFGWSTCIEKECDFVNSLWPSDAIWRHRSGSTLAQVMACCLTAPSHYLNQCWLTISKVHAWHSPEGICVWSTADTHQRNKIENLIFKIASRLPRGQWVNNLLETSMVWHHISFPNSLGKSKTGSLAKCISAKISTNVSHIIRGEMLHI